MAQTTDYSGQFDHKLRIVSLPNLEAMCERVSSMCHRFYVESVKGKYARIEYNNPDEWGYSHLIVALFPIIDYGGTIGVILDINKVLYCGADCEDWQAFEQLIDCPELWRKNSEATDWHTKEEIEAQTT